MTSEPGLYVMDEPESAPSFDGSLALVALMIEMLRQGSQIVLATHSPLLAALPGAQVLQLDERGVRPVAYDDTELVSNWRHFLQAPQAFLRHLA